MREAPGEEDYKERVSMNTVWREPSAPATCREIRTAKAQSLEAARWERGKAGRRGRMGL